MKHLKLLLLSLICSYASFAQVAAISGPSIVCIGTPCTYSDATPGGVWSCSSPIISIDVVTGAATGISIGVTTISYTVGGTSALMPVTVSAAVPAITGTPSVCEGSSTTLANSMPGGVWTSTAPGIGSVDPVPGIVTGITPGVTTIGYTIGWGCNTSVSFTVNAMSPVYSVTGGGAYCSGGTGSTVGLSNSSWGSSYQLYNGSIPYSSPVIGTGSAISFGLQTVAGTYTVQANPVTSCASSMSGSAVISINPLPMLFNVTGGGTFCTGGTGLGIGLDGSQFGVNYALYYGASLAGVVPGTGAALSFGLYTGAGSYTVIATNVITGCSRTMAGSSSITSAANPTIYTLSGGGTFCAGTSSVPINLSSSDVGINYSLYNGGTLVSTLPGTGTPLSFGPLTSAGSYTIVATNPTTGCYSTTTAATIVVNPLPVAYPVMGGGAYCSGGIGVHIMLMGSNVGINYQLQLAGAPVGGPIIGTGGSMLDFGFFTLPGTYFVYALDVTTGCTNTMAGSATVSITPSVTPSVTISATPGTTFCAGTTATFTPTPSGGGLTPTYSWQVNGVASGMGGSYSYVPANGDIVNVIMTSSAICASPTTATSSPLTMTVTTPSVTATPTTASCGGLVTLTATGAVTYSWSPSTGLSCTACASPTLSPTTTTVYTVLGTDGSGCTGTASAIVSGNRISGHITYTGVSTDIFKVWLVQYNPLDSSIAALDSMNSCMDGGIPYYEFDSKPAGDYLVKAKLTSAVPGTSGYMPTYGLSSTHWDSAATITHVASSDTLHINMVYGTVPAGPGFISGYVISGAGKGTAGDVPAPGMTIYLKNATGDLITFTTTATDGTYSFSNLAYGTYFIYPESYKYYTTPSAPVVLATGADSARAINFKQHRTAGTITPLSNVHTPQPVQPLNELAIFPNPNNGQLNIQWTEKYTGTASVSITDIVGQVVYTGPLDLSTTNSQAKLDISLLTEGVYIISIKGDNLLYTNKIIKK